MTDLHRPWLEQGLQVGWYLDWQGHTYRIRAFDTAKLVLHVEQLVTNEVRLCRAGNAAAAQRR